MYGPIEKEKDGAFVLIGMVGMLLSITETICTLTSQTRFALPQSFIVSKNIVKLGFTILAFRALYYLRGRKPTRDRQAIAIYNRKSKQYTYIMLVAALNACLQIDRNFLVTSNQSYYLKLFLMAHFHYVHCYGGYFWRMFAVGWSALALLVACLGYLAWGNIIFTPVSMIHQMLISLHFMIPDYPLNAAEGPEFLILGLAAQGPLLWGLIINFSYNLWTFCRDTMGPHRWTALVNFLIPDQSNK